jgi:hypothetical protein
LFIIGAKDPVGNPGPLFLDVGNVGGEEPKVNVGLLLVLDTDPNRPVLLLLAGDGKIVLLAAGNFTDCSTFCEEFNMFVLLFVFVLNKEFVLVIKEPKLTLDVLFILAVALFVFVFVFVLVLKLLGKIFELLLLAGF